MKDGREDEESRGRREKRVRCGTREREEGEMRDKGRGKRGRLVMEERRGGDLRWGREEAEIRE